MKVCKAIRIGAGMVFAISTAAMSQACDVGPECTTDDDCPPAAFCGTRSGSCESYAGYGAAPDWGMSMNDDDPLFPEKGEGGAGTVGTGEGGGENGGGQSGGGGGGVAGGRPGGEGSPPAVAEGADVCVDEHTTVVLYMSADDSNSKASPVIARKMINAGTAVPAWLIRTYEFLNYYTISYPVPRAGDLNVVPQMVADKSVAGTYVLQIGVQSPHVTNARRRPLNLTFSLDNSGSMDGAPIESQKAVLRAIASQLRRGDVVSMVTWNDSQNVVMDSHFVDGPNDAVFLREVEARRADGSTNLNQGLREGYRLARKNRDPGHLSRLILISDGQANVGTTDAEIIAENSRDNESEGIYLVGVGTGNGYDDTVMDTVTDKGKGAYVFIDTAAEAEKQFTGDRFVSNLDVAAMDVRMRLRLPPSFRVVEFHGEQISGNPAAVNPQHLAPNAAMIYHQSIGSCTREPFGPHDELVVTVEYTDPATRERLARSVTATGAELLGDGADGSARPQLVKGNAVVTYAEALKRLYRAAPADAAQVCGRAITIVGSAEAILTLDPDVREIDGLLQKYCAMCVETGCGFGEWDGYGNGERGGGGAAGGGAGYADAGSSSGGYDAGSAAYDAGGGWAADSGAGDGCLSPDAGFDGGMDDGTGGATCTGELAFADPALESVVREAVGNNGGPVTAADVAALETLIADDRGIGDLLGIECLAALSEIRLAGNVVGDLRPLAGLGALDLVDLDANMVFDLAPLADNSALGPGDTVIVTGNPLDCATQAPNIGTLRDRGVQVVTDCR